jgi:hypothetical protein
MRTRVLVVVVLLALVPLTLPFQGCGDNDNSGPPCCPACGDGVCSGDERGCNCTQDCGATVCTQVRPVCGDGVCERSGSPGESHERCPADCPLDCRQCESPFQVFAHGTSAPGSACPAGTTEAYRDSGYIVCDDCAANRDCEAGSECLTRCGPGCENDTGSCCPVRVCTPG